MQLRRPLLAFLVGFWAWSLGNMIWGSRGQEASLRLAQALEEHDRRLAELRLERELLEGDFQALLKDPERVALAARALGYYRGDELRFAPQNPSPPALTRPPASWRNGAPEIPASEPSPIPGTLGMIGFLLTLIVVEWVGSPRRSSARRSAIREIPGDVRTG